MAEPTYTIFVRVPIPRGSFVDPPAVSWDSAKDEALWKILSGATQKEIDWNSVADRFEVQVDFLFQQVAYLTERHASQVRAQVRKATAAAKGSAAQSPIPGSDSTGVANLRTASALSVRRDSPRTEGPGAAHGSAAGTTTAAAASSSFFRPPISRNASGNTAVFREAGSSSLKMGSRPAAPAAPAARLGDASRRTRLSSLPVAPPASPSQPQAASPLSPRAEMDAPPSPEPADGFSSSDDDSSPAQSRIFKRPPRYQPQQEDHSRYDDDEDEESEPAFQRYEPAQPSNTLSYDMSSTVRGSQNDGRRRNTRSNTGASNQARFPHSSDSLGSPQRVLSRHERQEAGPTSPSPRRTIELAATRGDTTGSEGTPSMGSSYSDLEDTSITQSAMEEAMVSRINRGVGSRFSISQAFRSHYLPGSAN